MTDKELLNAAWHYKGGYLMREMFTEALGLEEGPAAFKAYVAGTSKKLPGKVRSHWEPLLENLEERRTLAA